MMGMSTDQIAEVFTMDAAEVVKILEQVEKSTAKDKKSSDARDSTQGLNSLVKRLMTDPRSCAAPSPTS